MKEQRPAFKRRAAKTQFGSYALIKLAEDNMNDDGVGIQAVDTRRVREIGSEFSVVVVSKPPEVIGEEPPDVFKKMGTGNLRDAMPKDGRFQIRRRRGG